MNNKHFHRTKTLERELLIAGLVLILGHIFGSFESWYDKYPFFDVFVHFTGGFWVALVFLAVLPSFRTGGRTKKLFFAAAAFSFAVGGLWELLEFTIENHYLVNFQGPPLDTLSDLIIDTLGGLAAALYVRRRG
jgi:uncharacterized membrane protein YjdF